MIGSEAELIKVLLNCNYSCSGRDRSETLEMGFDLGPEDPYGVVGLVVQPFRDLGEDCPRSIRPSVLRICNPSNDEVLLYYCRV